MTAPGPFTSSELPFERVAGLPFAACVLPSAVSVSRSAALADAFEPFKAWLPDFAVCRVCCVGRAEAPSADEPAVV